MINEYQTQNRLNPKLWDGDQLRPKLQSAFIKISEAFYKFLDLPDSAEILDIILIGSNANYNWTEYSDIDLHVLINYLQVDPNYHMANKYLHAKKSLWNMHYPLTYKGMRIELYAQDSEQEMHSSVGVYSVLHNTWIRKPKSDLVSIDDSTIELKADPYEYEIQNLKLDDPNLEQKIDNIKQRLQHLRKAGLEAVGEYSVENLAYKHLRNKGLIDRLKELEQTATMSNLQVETALREWNPRDTYEKTKGQVKRFVSAMKTEKDETKQALAMLLQHINGTTKLSPEEWKWIGNQMKDVVKVLGLTTMAVAPGGSLVAILAKALKADKYLLPSSLQKQDEPDEVTESLIMHVTGQKQMDAPAWKRVMRHTDAVLDPEGQWKHPGRCTMIPTQDGRITMTDVPHPVLGIDNTGHMQLMHPEYNYQFPGRLVFEIPHTAQWKTMIMQLQNAIKNGSRYAK